MTGTDSKPKLSGSGEVVVAAYLAHAQHLLEDHADCGRCGSTLETFIAAVAIFLEGERQQGAIYDFGIAPHPEFGGFSDEKLIEYQETIESRIVAARQAKEELAMTWHQQEMNMLQIERKRRTGDEHQRQVEESAKQEKREALSKFE